MRIGIIALQGNVEEHAEALARAFDGEIAMVRHAGVVPSCDAIVIPGGESTTLCRLAWEEGIAQEIIEGARQGLPILGTCAGLILLACRGDDEVGKTGQRLLCLMDTAVDRNAFGRQRESFEAPLDLPFIGGAPFHAIFIRAPAIVSAGSGVEVLGRLGERIVAARQGNIVALAFHPELTDDPRIHEYFLRIVRGRLEK